MKTVPQEIINKAKICPYGFACLKDSDHEQCKKTCMIVDDLFKIIPKAGVDVDCNPYLIRFEHTKDCYCACPVYSYLQ